MTDRKWFWISRDKSSVWKEINIHVTVRRPRISGWDDEIFATGRHDVTFCARYFKQFTGVVLKPGEVKKIEVTVREVK